ncbi:NAD(P)-dependent alcohol dehydrogenase [Spirosoma sp. RP8]|uniref:NAD(P)-dependent alcohol dehydrogenase n=1 Tax=Spirosoma liriopis TaxID=2937440 RepID=A0ABT0HR57_9BACT|nr:NAD(P)-dependent alcohol dehydrogenase [Spirosoma liriopis]MCK8494672.1 NAD(P)-dependent alcohol dehydrogenase [Spirosoma liriopis]
MKAAVLEHYGDPSEFKIKEVDAPTIEDGQILIRNRASSVNPVDVLVRQGKMRLVSGLFGEQIIGCDFAGTVVESRSSRFKAGDEVFGCKSPMAGHTYAELVAVDADVAALKPETISFTEAASLPTTALTAWQGLLKEGELKSGDQVLINGCTGGVGVAAVQIAKSLGATVTGTCQGDHAETARELGCDQVINYETEPIPKDNRYALIFDAAGKLTFSDVEDSLTPDGLLVTTKPDATDFASAVSSLIDLAKPRMKLVIVSANAPDLMHVKDLVESGKLRPLIAQTFPLEQVGPAHQMLETDDFVGKITLEIT